MAEVCPGKQDKSISCLEVYVRTLLTSESLYCMGCVFPTRLFSASIRGSVSLGGARAPQGERREEARALTILGQKWTRA